MVSPGMGLGRACTLYLLYILPSITTEILTNSVQKTKGDTLWFTRYSYYVTSQSKQAIKKQCPLHENAPKSIPYTIYTAIIHNNKYICPHISLLHYFISHFKLFCFQRAYIYSYIIEHDSSIVFVEVLRCLAFFLMDMHNFAKIIVQSVKKSLWSRKYVIS